MPSHHRRRRRTAPIALASTALIAFLTLHRLIPSSGGWMSVVESALPYTLVVVLVLVVAAIARGTRLAGAFVVASAVVWAIAFLPALVPAATPTADRFVVASENIHADSDTAASIVTDLASREPDAIALQEVDGASRAVVDATIGDAYPHSYIVGTVGLWSRTELSDGERLDLGLGWDRALAVDVDTPLGTTRVYVVHLASFRPGDHVERDTMLAGLGDTLTADESERVMVVGDFNAASTDREFVDAIDGADVAEASPASLGTGFTWPALLPLARLDHTLVRGFPAAVSAVLPVNGSDHRGVTVTVGR